MIKQIKSPEDIDRKFLAESWCGKRILSYLDAYGTGYDFCRFFWSSGSIILLINSTMLICGDSFDSEELNAFATMHRPFRIEGEQTVVLAIKNEGYKSLHRTCFQLTAGNGCAEEKKNVDTEPSLDEVYGILAEGFPNLTEYRLWLADTSHRIRHGISRVLTYCGCTTATLSFDIDDCILVSQVATKVSARGSGCARRFLTWLADELDAQGKTAVLNALDIRESFYREIGFKAVSEEFVLELKENSENILKGKLQYND